jgi:hypothetical protein
MACALLFFAPGNNQLWRVAEWPVQKANSELKAVAVREAAVVLPAAAAVVVNPEVVAAKVVEEVASQVGAVVDKAAANQAAAVVDRAAVAAEASLVAAVVDRAAAVRAVVVVDARAAAADKVAGDKAVEEAAGPVEGAAVKVVAEWEVEARAVVAAVAVPPVVAAAETARPLDSGGASRICGAPLFY